MRLITCFFALLLCQTCMAGDVIITSSSRFTNGFVPDSVAFFAASNQVAFVTNRLTFNQVIVNTEVSLVQPIRTQVVPINRRIRKIR